jgi:eukaryotic-like serine/threonine-protein kinase
MSMFKGNARFPAARGDSSCPECLSALTLQDALDGRLSGPAFWDVERHLASCSLCAELIALAPRFAPPGINRPDRASETGATQPPPDEPAGAPPDQSIVARGTIADRYVVLDPIGGGGMGQVYAAYDPDLDRKVALKILRPDIALRAGRDESMERMRREARAIARLSHPNVVVVYSSGTIGDRVFIAMELIDGMTISQWLRAAPRTTSQILRVFLCAGRGLAAAHAAGIVHRDFKPQNVMIASNGDVRVMDFGMARVQLAERHRSIAAQGATPGSAASTSGGETRLTQAGSILGTPAYMAPEQLQGKESGPASDQYSFCAALHEALFGVLPPSPGRDVASTRGSVGAAHARESPHRKVPGPVRALLVRGLKENAADRFASMDALLALLEASTSRRRRRLIFAAAVLGTLLVATWAGRATSHHANVCEGGFERISRVWEPGEFPGSSRQRAARAFTASGITGADGIFARVAQMLDRYASAWAASYADACAATRIRGEQSEALLDLRMSCLQRRYDDLRELVDQFGYSRVTTVRTSIEAAVALPAIATCSDVRALGQAVPPPAPAIRPVVDQVRRGLSRARALFETGREEEAIALSTSLVQQANATRYGPLRAEARMELALASINRTGTETLLRDALFDAQSFGQDEIVATAATLLIYESGHHGRIAEAHLWDGIAEAALRRIGGSVRLWSWLFQHRGTLLAWQGRHREALTEYQHALDLKETGLGSDHTDSCRTLWSLAEALRQLNRPQEALAALDRARDIWVRRYGSALREPLDAHINRGETLVALHRLQEAEEEFHEVFNSLQKASPVGDLLWAYPLSGLGTVALESGRLRSAIMFLEQTLRLRSRSWVPAGELAETEYALARALWQAGHDRARAVRLAERALADYRSLPESDTEVATITTWLQGRRPPRDRGHPTDAGISSREASGRSTTP